MSCKASDVVYCIVNPETNRLHRVTFSLQLANMIINNHFPQYEIRKASYVRGRRLNPGETSAALYGIVSTKKDLLLRVPMQKETAEMYACCDSRHIEEIFLRFKI